MNDFIKDFRLPGFFRRLKHQWKLGRIERLLAERKACEDRILELMNASKADPSKNYSKKISAYCDLVIRYEKLLIDQGYKF